MASPSRAESRYPRRTFTLALLVALKEQGLHTALDTTGFASWTILEKTVPYMDLYLLDLKGMDTGRAQSRSRGPQRADPCQCLQARCRRRQVQIGSR